MKYTCDGEVEEGGRKLVRILLAPDYKPDAPPPPTSGAMEFSGTGSLLFDNATGRVAVSTQEFEDVVEGGLHEDRPHPEDNAAPQGGRQGQVAGVCVRFAGSRAPAADLAAAGAGSRVLWRQLPRPPPRQTTMTPPTMAAWSRYFAAWSASRPGPEVKSEIGAVARRGPGAHRSRCNLLK
jgi:hypothetical protein